MASHDPHYFTLNTNQMAYMLGITDRQMRKYEAAGCPKVARGEWDPKVVLEWLRNNHASYMPHQGDEEADTIKKQLEKAGLEIRQAKAETAQIELKKLRESVVDNDLLADHLGKIFTVFKTLATGLGTKLAPLVSKVNDPVENKEIIDEEAYKMLNTLASLDENNLDETIARLSKETKEGKKGRR